MAVMRDRQTQTGRQVDRQTGRQIAGRKTDTVGEVHVNVDLLADTIDGWMD